MKSRKSEECPNNKVAASLLPRLFIPAAKLRQSMAHGHNLPSEQEDQEE